MKSTAFALRISLLLSLLSSLGACVGMQSDYEERTEGTHPIRPGDKT